MRKIAVLLIVLFSTLAGAQSSLKIGPGDLLNIEVFDVPELKQEVRVSDVGDADFAILGKIHVSEMTVGECTEKLGSLLQQRGLVRHPQVLITVREYATQGIAVSGEVRKPGIYSAVAPRSLLQVISEAGGLPETASPKITIKRFSGEQEVIVFNTPEGPSTLLRPGDGVLVARAGVAYIIGDVTRSGGYLMQDSGELTVAQLVAMGGGLLPTAKASKAKLIRKIENGHEERVLDVKKILSGRAADLRLAPDDILFIPNSLFKTAGTRLQNIVQMTVGAAIYTSLN